MELARKTGVNRDRISYALGEVEPGIITCSPSTAYNVARELGLEHRFKDFKEHFWRTNQRGKKPVMGAHTQRINTSTRPHSSPDLKLQLR